MIGSDSDVDDFGFVDMARVDSDGVVIEPFECAVSDEVIDGSACCVDSGEVPLVEFV